VKDLQEENSKIKAPIRDYNEIDFTKDKYHSERNKEKERSYLQKPQFVNKHTNEEPRFVELEKDKDVKNIFELNKLNFLINNLIEYNKNRILISFTII